MRTRWRTAIGLLVAGTLLLSPAGPVRAADPVVTTDAEPAIRDATCVDTSAMLVNTSDGVLRCVGGVPVPRPTPWNAGSWCAAILVTGTSLANDGLPGTVDVCVTRTLRAIPWPHAIEAGR